MFLTKKAIPRRALLKSGGAALALPLLDAMSSPALLVSLVSPGRLSPQIQTSRLAPGTSSARREPSGDTRGNK